MPCLISGSTFNFGLKAFTHWACNKKTTWTSKFSGSESVAECRTFAKSWSSKNALWKKEWSQHQARWVGPDACKQEKLEMKILGSLNSQVSELSGRPLPGNSLTWELFRNKKKIALNIYQNQLYCARICVEIFGQLSWYWPVVTY